MAEWAVEVLNDVVEAELLSLPKDMQARFLRTLAEFIRLALQAGPTNSFLADFLAFREPVARAGVLNALSQALLKICSPGIPDFYQGNELWDLSLVDPDNRRPVDFNTRRAMLEEIASGVAKDPQALLDKLLANPRDGRMKMYVIYRALNFRRENAGLFAEGSYMPLDATGERKHHVIAFARSASGRSLIVAAGRFFTRLGMADSAITTSAPFPDGRVWTNTFLPTPGEFGSRYVDLLSSRVVETRMNGTPHLAMDEIFARMPLAMLVADRS